MDDVNASGDPTDLSHYCYDNETRVMTSSGWKYFDDLTYDDEIMTLNASSGEKVYSKPYEIQEFEHDGEMYKIVLSNYPESSEGSSLTKPAVERTLTMDCFLKDFSSDQIGIVSDNASAKYETSFACGEIVSALDKNLLYRLFHYAIICISMKNQIRQYART